MMVLYSIGVSTDQRRQDKIKPTTTQHGFERSQSTVGNHPTNRIAMVLMQLLRYNGRRSDLRNLREVRREGWAHKSTGVLAEEDNWMSIMQKRPRSPLTPIWPFSFSRGTVSPACTPFLLSPRRP